MVSSHGCFVWYELTTTDAEAAKAFYADVVGWGLRDASMPGAAYTLFTAGEVAVAGLIGPAGRGARNGRAAALDRLCRRRRRGRCDRSTEAPGRHRVRPADGRPRRSAAFLSSPIRKRQRSALIKWLNPDQEQPAAPASPGHVGWHELLAVDWETAFAFYGELFGWQKADADVDAIGTYQLFSAGGQTIGGMFTKPADGADAVLALLLQCRRHRRGGRARQGRRRRNPRRPARSAGRRGSSDAPTRKAPCSR